jgi:methylmalonyl-CoA mutase N-terminal domain/subunit
LHKHDPAVGERRINQMQRLRAERDATAAEASLKRLADGAKGDDNMIPLMIECVESYVTLGEICRTLRDTWGEQRERLAL